MNLEDDEIVKYGEMKNNGIIKWRPALLIEYPLTILFGKEYVYGSSNHDPMGLFEETTRLVFKGISNVTVSGEIFKQCLVLEKEITLEYKERSKTIISSREYYAPHVGSVYSEYDFALED